jgi:hypothetical protein
LKIAQWLNQLTAPSPKGVDHVVAENREVTGEDQVLKDLGMAPTKENREAAGYLIAEGIEPTEEAIDAVKTLMGEKTPPAVIRSVLGLVASKDIAPTAENLMRLTVATGEGPDYASLFRDLGLVSEGEEGASLPLDTSDPQALMQALKLEMHFGDLEPLPVDFSKGQAEIDPTEVPDAREPEETNATQEETERPEATTAEEVQKGAGAFLEQASEQIATLIAEIESRGHPLPETVSRDDLAMLLVRETTERTLAAEKTFLTEKQTLLTLLRQVDGSTPRASLTEAIERLDDLMTKSDLTLYTSMEEEKALGSWRRSLAEARDRLASGDLTGAKKLTGKVERALQRLTLQFEKVHVEVRPKLTAEARMTGRQGIEQLRRLGLNHEMETAKSLLMDKPRPDPNLKQVFAALKEAFGEETATGLRRSIEGQQLQNKPTHQTQDQYHLQIPVVLQEKIKPLSVMINAKKEDGRVDAANCELYFVLDLERFGKTGVRLQIKEGEVKTTVKNDDLAFREDAKRALEPYAAWLSDMGFTLSELTFSSMGTRSREENRGQVPVDRLDVSL